MMLWVIAIYYAKFIYISSQIDAFGMLLKFQIVISNVSLGKGFE